MTSDEGTVLITVTDENKPEALEFAKKMKETGFRIMATDGTCKYLSEKSVDAVPVKKLHEGRPNIVDAIKNGEIQLVVNTPAGRTSQFDDSYIRKSAIRFKVPYITTTAAAMATARGIAETRKNAASIKALQEYHANLN